MKPMIPSTGGLAEETSFLNDGDLKSATRGLLDAATDQIRGQTTATMLEKVLGGGSGKMNHSLDLEGIGGLLGGVSEAMTGTNNFLLNLMRSQLMQKGSGNTDNSQLMMILVLFLLQQQQQPRQDNSAAQWITFFQAFMEQDRKHQSQIVDMMNTFHSQRYQELEARSGPDPITSQIYQQVLPTIVGQAIGQSKKDPLDQILELKEKADRLGGTLNLFGNNDGSMAEKLQMRAMDLKEKQMYSDERKHRDQMQSKYQTPKVWGDMLGKVLGGFTGNQGMSQDFTAMMGGGMPDGRQVDPMTQQGVM